MRTSRSVKIRSPFVLCNRFNAMARPLVHRPAAVRFCAMGSIPSTLVLPDTRHVKREADGAFVAALLTLPLIFSRAARRRSQSCCSGMTSRMDTTPIPL